MAEFVSIQVTGSKELQAELLRAVQQLQRPRDLMQALGAMLVRNIEKRFDTKRDPAGTPWRPLAPATLTKYAEEDQGKRRGTILERTGRMRDSLTANVGDDFVEVGMNRLTNGGGWSIPLLHETGTRRMPRRGIFLADPDAGTLGAQDERDIEDELRSFLDNVFGA
jgi:phage virion morphogenesis protein